MLGIELGASGVTLSSGESLAFDSEGAPSDLLLRISDEEPVVRIRAQNGHVAEHEVVTATELYADLLATALRADRVDAGRLGMTGQLELAGPLFFAAPGWWTPSTRTDLTAALLSRGLRATLVNGAEAAVHGHMMSGEHLPDTVAVVSAKSESVSLTIVQRCDSGPTALLTPSAVIREGGHALDAAVLRHVVSGLKSMGDAIDVADRATIIAARSALDSCRDLRESLSFQTTAMFDPPLPGASHRVLITRSELEEIAAPWINAVSTQIGDALGRSAQQAEAILLTGGLAAMPLLAHRLSADLGLDVLATAHPSTLVARGAEVLAAATSTTRRGLRSRWPFRRPERTRELVRR